MKPRHLSALGGEGGEGGGGWGAQGERELTSASPAAFLMSISSRIQIANVNIPLQHPRVRFSLYSDLAIISAMRRRMANGRTLKSPRRISHFPNSTLTLHSRHTVQTPLPSHLFILESCYSVAVIGIA